MRIQVHYAREATLPDGRHGYQMVVREISPATLFGDDAENVIEVRTFWIRPAHDPDHPLEYRPQPAHGFW